MNFFKLSLIILTILSTKANIYSYDKFTNRNIIEDYTERPFYFSKTLCSIDYVNQLKSQDKQLNYTPLLRNNSNNSIQVNYTKLLLHKKNYYDMNYIYNMKGNYTYNNVIMPKLSRYYLFAKNNNSL